MFGRRKKNVAAADDRHDEAGWRDEYDETGDDRREDEGSDDLDQVEQSDGGPYDFEDLDDDVDPAAGRLDLGSVFVPMPQGGQIQVEMSQTGSPQAVHIVTEHGRITVAAYAAPKSPGQWRDVASELAQSLRDDNAEVSVESGPWGREVFAVTPNADLRFIGADGYRWMVRVVVASPTGANTADSPLAATARTILRETIVKRGAEPHPVRTPLPIVLPAPLVEQLEAAQQQQREQLAAQQAQALQQAQGGQVQGGQVQGGVPQPSAQPGSLPQQPGQVQQPPAQPGGQRRGESGSAMQQLGL